MSVGGELLGVRAGAGRWGSERYTAAAPAAFAHRTASAPMGPPPVISTVSPGPTLPRSTPYIATAAGSIKAPCS